MDASIALNLAGDAPGLTFSLVLPAETQTNLCGKWPLAVHRLTSFLDLGDAAGPVGAAERYLRPAPTDWSDWVLPETPRIEMEELILGPPAPVASPTPKVALYLVPPAGSGGAGDDRWLYRAVVRRQQDFTLSSGNGVEAKSGWRLVGQPVAFFAGSGPVRVLDDQLDRADVDRELACTYEVIVKQFAVVLPNTAERPRGRAPRPRAVAGRRRRRAGPGEVPVPRRRHGPAARERQRPGGRGDHRRVARGLSHPGGPLGLGRAQPTRARSAPRQGRPAGCPAGRL